jgi:crotonobetainyl-CoA:carnitine CoA-transferase CaiB-like acyl-CoA transferase
VSGLHAVYATLAAVMTRHRDGLGQHVEVPMFECISSFNLLEHLCDETFAPPTGRWGYARQLNPARQPLRTQDGYISIAPYVEDRWVRFFQASGHPDVLEDPRFATKELRNGNTTGMYEVAATFMPERTTADWLSLLKKANVPAIQVNEIGEVLDDPHLAAVGLFERRDHPTEGRYVEVRPPVRFGGFAYPEARHAPTIGQHTAEIDRELGID